MRRLGPSRLNRKNAVFFSFFEHIEEIRRIADIHTHNIVASVLYKTQLLHDTRHFVQSSPGLDYSVSFSIVAFFFFQIVYRPVVFWVIRVFYAFKKEGES